MARPAPGSFTAGQYEGPHGALSYRLYMPQGSDRRRLPLVVMLHGCTQTAVDFARGTDMNALADEFGFIVLYPEQSQSANPHRCWNWHRPSDQRRGSGEPAAIAALTLHTAALCRANPSRIYIAGISAGGSAAEITGRCYPDIYAAVGLHSAVASGNVTSLPGALSAMRNGGVGAALSRKARLQPIIIFHGDSDRTVHPGNASGFICTLNGSPAQTCVAQVSKGQSGGGRDFTRTVYTSPASKVLVENWTVHGGGHAWFGGNRAGTYTDPAGPDASREIIRFFLAHRLPPVVTKSAST
ncbi:MAG: PHB depolymerase family esterase [Pseudomonadota bacterium]